MERRSSANVCHFNLLARRTRGHRLTPGRNDASYENDIRNELMNITDIEDGLDVSFAD